MLSDAKELLLNFLARHACKTVLRAHESTSWHLYSFVQRCQTLGNQHNICQIPSDHALKVGKFYYI